MLGALSSGMLLYGASLIYGFTGSIDFAVIASVAQGQPAAQNIGLIVGLVFLLVGLAFKVSRRAVPHVDARRLRGRADAGHRLLRRRAQARRHGAAGAHAAVRAFPASRAQWQQIIVFLSIASMLLGAFAAIGQRNIKRLMAYSSIGHVGYALIGLAANSEAGTQARARLSRHLPRHDLGTFACILSMRRRGGRWRTSTSSPGLAKTNLPMAFVLAMLLFSMAGIPPLAGFFAKLYVFVAAIKADLVTLAVIGVLASVVGAYYYLRIVKIMFFDDAKAAFLPVDRGAGVVMALSGAFVLLFVLVAGAAGQRRAHRGARAACRDRRRRPMTDAPAELPEGCKLLDLDEVDGTNAEAMRRVLAGERGPLWIIADRQTAGRGRSGRAWASQPGNLFASFVTDARLPARQGRAAVARRRRRRHRRDPPRGRAFPACASNGRTTFSSARRRRAAFWLKAPRARRTPGTVAVIGVGLNLVSAPDDLGQSRDISRAPRISAFAARGVVLPGADHERLDRHLGRRRGLRARARGLAGARRRHRRGAHRQRRAAARSRAPSPASTTTARCCSTTPTAASSASPSATLRLPRERRRRMSQQQRGVHGRGAGGDELVFVALGGLGEIGMNAYLYGFGPEDARRWLMVDCGITFPEGENDPGIDVILPDVRFIEENRADLAGIVITHAHEDHIGAVIELWPRLKAPIYATPFTAGMLKSKLAEYGNSLQIPDPRRPARLHASTSARSTSSWSAWRTRSRR